MPVTIDPAAAKMIDYVRECHADLDTAFRVLSDAAKHADMTSPDWLAMETARRLIGLKLIAARRDMDTWDRKLREAGLSHASASAERSGAAS